MKPINKKFLRLRKFINFCFGFVSRERQLPLEEKPKRILILDLHLIGDMVWLIPLLKSIRLKFPQAHVSLLCGSWGVDIIGNNSSLVNEFIIFDAPWVKKTKKYLNCFRDIFDTILFLRRFKWDIAIDTRGDFRNIFILWLSNARALIGWDFTGGSPLMTDVMKDDKTFEHIVDHHKAIAVALNALDEHDPYLPFIDLDTEDRKSSMHITEYIGVHLGASNYLRQFELADAVTLIDVLISRHTGPITIFCSSDYQYMKQLVSIYRGNTSVNFWYGDLHNFVIQLSRCMHLYCMDSGPAHIAAAFGAEVTVFFGPADSKFVKPIGNRINVIENMLLQCRPCNQKKCSNPNFKQCLSDLPLKIQ